MILTSTSRNSLTLPVAYGRGADVWWVQYAVSLKDIAPGTQITATGRTQGKDYNPFAVEFRTGLFLSSGLVNPAPGNGSCLHPILGENLGPDVADKYGTLGDTWSFVMPDGLVDPYLAYRVSLRSTQAISTTRVEFGNGYLQAVTA